MTPPQPKRGDLLDRYEALRAHALGDARLGFVPLGLAILRHRGVIAWMDAEEAVLEPTDSVRELLRDREAEAEVVSPVRSELVALLAGTALLVAAGGG